MGSTSRRDKHAPVRRARVLQVLVIQGALTLVLLGFVVASWGEPRGMLVFGATTLVPIGWSVAIWGAYRREEAARRAGEWNKAWDERERKRTFRLMGAFLGTAAVLAIVAIVLF